MSYSRGVLIHNFNEDRFGEDLQTLPKPIDQARVSVSHAVHHWKIPEEVDRVDPGVHGVPRHILFGHTGDMRDPHTNLQKTEFAAASKYFYQDPAKIAQPGTLTADGFTISDDPLKTQTEPSVIADKIKSGWGMKRQTHSLPPGDRFMTEHMQSYCGGVRSARRKFKNFNELSQSVEAKMSRSGGSLRSTGQLVMQEGR